MSAHSGDAVWVVPRTIHVPAPAPVSLLELSSFEEAVRCAAAAMESFRLPDRPGAREKAIREAKRILAASAVDPLGERDGGVQGAADDSVQQQ